MVDIAEKQIAPPTDRRSRRSRRLLLEAFRHLLAEKGFDAISVQDIADRADVNRGTFYAHFPDKYALLEQVVGESFRDALLARVPIDAPFTYDNLEQLTVAVLEFLGEFMSHCRPADRSNEALVETSMRRELHGRLLAWTTPQASAHEPEAIRPEVTAMVMSWAIFGSGLEWSQATERDSAETTAREILGVFVPGLAEGPLQLSRTGSPATAKWDQTPLSE